MQAYLLVRARPCAAMRIADAMRRLRGVKKVDVLGGGPYDILVDLSRDTFADLGSTVAEIRDVPGVETAVACTAPGPDGRE